MTQPDLVSKLREVIAKWRESANMKYGLAPHASAQLSAAADELEFLLGRAEAEKVEVCGVCGDFLAGDYCATCDAHVEEDARDRAPAPCGPSQPETDGGTGRQPELLTSPSVQAASPEPLEFHKPGQIPVNTPTCDKCGKMFLECRCSQPSPSTPIVPGTAGLSALLERIALDLSELKVMHTDYAGYIVHNSDPTQQQLEYDKHCPACVIKQVLEAVKLNGALAERPAPAGEVKGEK